MPSQTTSAIILFAHGARDPLWAEPLKQLREHVSTTCPAHLVRLAFLELMSPNIESCVEELVSLGVNDVTVVPVFVARGAHLRRDLPKLIDSISTQYPTLHITLTEALGEALPVQIAMAQWIGQVASAERKPQSQ